MKLLESTETTGTHTHKRSRRSAKNSEKFIIDATTTVNYADTYGFCIFHSKKTKKRKHFDYTSVFCNTTHETITFNVRGIQRSTEVRRRKNLAKLVYRISKNNNNTTLQPYYSDAVKPCCVVYCNVYECCRRCCCGVNVFVLGSHSYVCLCLCPMRTTFAVAF